MIFNSHPCLLIQSSIPKNCQFFPCQISAAEISHTLSITIGWFAITSNWSIVPDRRNIYTIRLDKIMKFWFKMENGVQAFPPRDKFWPIRGHFEKSLSPRYIWSAVTQNVQDGGEIKARFLQFIGRNWSKNDPIRHIYVSGLFLIKFHLSRSIIFHGTWAFGLRSHAYISYYKYERV